MCRLGPLSAYLMELALPDYAFLQQLPSQIAAAAVLLAQFALGGAGWSCTLEHYTSYAAWDLEAPASRLLAAWHHAQDAGAFLGCSRGCGVMLWLVVVPPRAVHLMRCLESGTPCQPTVGRLAPHTGRRCVVSCAPGKSQEWQTNGQWSVTLGCMLTLRLVLPVLAKCALPVLARCDIGSPIPVSMHS